MKELDNQPTDYYHANSFFQTNLQATLTELGLESIAQTEYCVDTTIRFAHVGYHCWMKSGLHTTVDSQLLTASTIIAHHEEIWQKNYYKKGASL